MRAPAPRPQAGVAARDAATLKAVVRRWASRVGVQPKRIHVQRMTTKWASCSVTGRVCFSRDLLLEDAPFQEVVIVHELLHLVAPNHGRLFRSLIKAYVPGWDHRDGSRIARVCGYKR